MFKLATTIEDLYQSQEATGNTLVDAVVGCLRQTRTQRSADVATYLGLDEIPYGERKLNGALELYLGVTLKEMILTWRALQARELLRDHSLTLDEVAHRCGFVQKKSLIDFFARRFGMTPMVFRTGRVSRHTEYRVNK